MKCLTPEIAWHNREPVFSVDIQGDNVSKSVYRLASGGADTHVLIWFIEYDYTADSKEIAKIDFVADLTRHQRAVNVVRFSPSSEFLASGDDESVILIWKRKSEPDISDNTDEVSSNKEHWSCVKTLRSHLDDVYDICWSPDSTYLISGSVDNTAIMWDISSGKTEAIFKEHKGFVQGVTWDPLQKYVVTFGSDRTLRTYSTTSRSLVSKCSKAPLPQSDDNEEEYVSVTGRIFHDDTLKTYFRRLTFSPDGNLLFVPAGILDVQPIQNSSNTNVCDEDMCKPKNATFVFIRDNFNEPIMYFPSGDQYSVAVRCCPILFKKDQLVNAKDEFMENNIFDLPYKMVIAVATKNSVLLYDTEHVAPFAYITDIHYTSITDLSWSSDGYLLVISSTDGFCTFVSFSNEELGIPWTENEAQVSPSKIIK